MKTPSNNTIALIILLVAVAFMAFLFAESRNDPSLRIAALVSGTGLVASLGAIASTMLTGKDLTKGHDTADVPPNGSTTDTATVTASTSTVTLAPPVNLSSDLPEK